MSAEPISWNDRIMVCWLCKFHKKRLTFEYSTDFFLFSGYEVTHIPSYLGHSPTVLDHFRCLWKVLFRPFEANKWVLAQTLKNENVCKYSMLKYWQSPPRYFSCQYKSVNLYISHMWVHPPNITINGLHLNIWQISFYFRVLGNTHCPISHPFQACFKWNFVRWKAMCKACHVH